MKNSRVVTNTTFRIKGGNICELSKAIYTVNKTYSLTGGHRVQVELFKDHKIRQWRFYVR
jgi:hypothetical protein